MTTPYPCRALSYLLAVMLSAAPLGAQSTTGTIQGVVTDNQGGVVPGATTTVRNIDTNVRRSAATNAEGAYRFLNMPVGNYELTVELTGFSRYVRSGLTLALNQTAVVDVEIRPAALTEVVEVRADAPLLNTRNAEVGVRFDTMRVAELPVMASRNIFTLARSAPGVSELASGQTNFSAGGFEANYSSNGARLRSNNIMIDGQDVNDPSVTGRQQPMNNTDIVQEIRLVTNQFAAEYGRAAGSVMNVITKSGTNSFDGSAFWFHNDNSLNTRSNLDKAAGRTNAPYRVENQLGGTIGGPVVRGRTFFFGSYQRWTDRRLGVGFTLTGAPSEAGRQVLQAAAGNRPQVQALLKHLPAGTPNGRSAAFTLGGQTYTVPLGSLTGSATQRLDDNQGTVRIDHQLTQNHTLIGRYLFDDQPTNNTGGTIQVTPPGLTQNSPSNSHAVNVWMNSVFGASISNEFRVALSHLGTITGADNPASMEIPSIEIAELGMNGFNASANRTAIGFAVNLPQFRYVDTHQMQNTLTLVRGSHVVKAGLDVRREYVKSFFFPTIRGLLRYPTLNAFVNDVAEATNINKPLPGGTDVVYYRWWDQYYFAQDDWRIGNSLTLNLGVRYELPGNNVQSLIALNERILQANNDNAVFGLSHTPTSDRNNVQPRLGFNWQPTRSRDGLLGMITGGDRFVVRGGYARTNDYAFLNIALNIASSFPFVAAIAGSNVPNAFTLLQNTPAGVPAGTNPNLLNRTVVADDFSSPIYDQFSLGIERQLSENLAMRVGYVGTFGNDLFQTLDGNPRQPFAGPTGPRVDPTRGVIRLRANTAESWYHSVQTGLDKRFSAGLSAGVHYTWSRFMDTASEIFNPSQGEVAVPQDSFNIAADKGRAAYDRPQRLSGNFVWELPWMREQQSMVARVLGGWQLSSFFTLQSGAPFTPLNGSDPTGALAGIDSLVGNAIRPMLNTDRDLSKMTIEELREAGGARLFRGLCGMPSATCPGERVGNAPRNLLRADGIGNIDIGITKNTRFANGHNIQMRIEMFNATNTRNFGIPDGRINSTNFLNQWATDGGNRRVWAALRYTF
ncbi:MAG: Outer rane receptor for ferrienterochelin and colicin [Acidobacteria bacterium]|nr:Outer rane receptor for ferrienterochelin and colicin [Acidobacteriota bacterium]